MPAVGRPLGVRVAIGYARRRPSGLSTATIPPPRIGGRVLVEHRDAQDKPWWAKHDYDLDAPDTGRGIVRADDAERRELPASSCRTKEVANSTRPQLRSMSSGPSGKPWETASMCSLMASAAATDVVQALARYHDANQRGPAPNRQAGLQCRVMDKGAGHRAAKPGPASTRLSGTVRARS
jgi:hypothetical protein